MKARPTKESENMIIKKLELQNFQVIKEFNADFEGNVYFITGDNELGKSTLLKAIGALLTGKRDEVLRNGEDKGFAKMIVGGDGKEYEVKLTFTKANPRGTFSIALKDSGRKSNNVSDLPKIFGYADFDAVEFSRWSETAEGRRKQIEVVKQLLPEKVRTRIDEIDVEVATVKDNRKTANAQVKTYNTICEQAKKLLNPGDEYKYTTKKDITALMEEQAQNARLIEKAKTVRATRDQRIAQIAEIPNRIDEENTRYVGAKMLNEQARINAKEELDEAIRIAKQHYEEIIEACDREREDIESDHATSIETINADKADLERRKANADAWLEQYEANNPEATYVAEQLKNAEKHNRIFALVEDYKSKKELLDNAISEQKGFECKLDNLAEERASLIANSKLPINGLSFTEDGLELNGVPFVPGKVSDSQIMEVAAKLIIASNPTVKVFRIARGESLGAKRLQAIIDIAKNNGFQGFIEEVRRGQDDLIVNEYTEKA